MQLMFAFAALAVLSPFLPLFLMWRCALLSVTAFIAAGFLAGPVHWSDQGLGYAIGVIILFLLIIGVALGLGLRIAVAGARGQLTQRALLGPDKRWRHLLDVISVGFAGSAAGLACAIGLAFAFADSALGRSLDLFIILIALLAALGALLLGPWLIRAFGVTVSAAIIGVSLVGSLQPTRILESAENLADGAPWCLASPPSAAPIASAAQLGFFAMHKGGHNPHLGLQVQGGAPFRANWSIRQQRFVEGDRGDLTPCLPRVDFADALTQGWVSPDAFIVGSTEYLIPPEMEPKAFPRMLSIRSSLVTGPVGTLPEFFERLEIRESATAWDMPDDAKPLTDMPSAAELDIEALLSGTRLIFAGTDQVTGRQVILECLRGAFANRDCFATVNAGAAQYAFFLPVEDIRHWSSATDKVEALFLGLRRLN
ncbi:hypothetical protein [Litoreibacter janthinus]|nr:hypothetical protein [Litoreibacter janthinus]